jgi:hypothetical protein
MPKAKPKKMTQKEMRAEAKAARLAKEAKEREEAAARESD